MAAQSLREVGELLAAKRAEVRDIIGKATDHSGELKMDQAGVDNLRQRNEELKDIGEKFDAMREAEAIRTAAFADQEATEEKGERGGSGYRETVPSGDRDSGAPSKGRHLASMIAASKGLQQFQAGEVKSYQITMTAAETKTLLTLGDINVQADRRPGIVPSAQAFQTVTDLMRSGTTSGNSLEYYEETTLTNNAAETAEGAAKPESALGFTLRTDPIRKIATWIPVTDEVLADGERLRSYIEGRLRFMVIKRREQQVLTGSGIAPNLLGILNRTGIQTVAKGTDPVFDAILKAMVLIQTTGDAQPNGIILNPTDWQDLMLTRTADGLYILGNPGDGQAAPRLWGASVRSVPAMTLNTGLVGDFTMAEFVVREGLTVTASSEHSTYFVENKVAILAEERVGLQVDRPAAFATVTGI